MQPVAYSSWNWQGPLKPRGSAKETALWSPVQVQDQDFEDTHCTAGDRSIRDGGTNSPYIAALCCLWPFRGLKSLLDAGNGSESRGMLAWIMAEYAHIPWGST